MLQLTTGNNFCLNRGLGCTAKTDSDPTKQKRTSLEEKRLVQTVHKRAKEPSSEKGPELETGKQRM